jgi:hypothetical protein
MAYQESCSTPKECAQWLIDHGWEYDGNKETEVYGKNFIPSPARSLEEMVGKCGTFAFAIAAGVVDNDYPPSILVLAASDVSHGMYLYQDSNGLWGYIQILTTLGQLIVDDHAPSFATIKELFYFYISEGNHTVDYDRYDFLTEDNLPADWLITQENIKIINFDTVQTGP